MRPTFGSRGKSTGGAYAKLKKPSVRSKIGPRILLIDDDATIRELGRTLLVHGGFEVELLDHGPTDHAFYASLSIDAAIVDLGLPGLNGADVIANLRSVPKNTQLPIVICTSSVDIEAIHNCYTQHAALTVIQKPVDWPRLINLMNRAVGRRDIESSAVTIA